MYKGNIIEMISKKVSCISAKLVLKSKLSFHEIDGVSCSPFRVTDKNGKEVKPYSFLIVNAYPAVHELDRNGLSSNSIGILIHRLKAFFLEEPALFYISGIDPEKLKE